MVSTRLTLFFSITLTFLNFAYAATPAVQWPAEFEKFNAMYLRGYRRHYETQKTPKTCFPALMRIVHQHYTGKYVTECRMAEMLLQKSYCYKDGTWIDYTRYVEDYQNKGFFIKTIRDAGYQVEYYELSKLPKTQTDWITQVARKLGENKAVAVYADALDSYKGTHILLLTGVRRDKNQRVFFEVYDPGTGGVIEYNPAKRSDFFFGLEPRGYVVMSK